MTVYRRQSLIPAGTFLVNDAVHVKEDDEQQAVTDTLTTTDHKHLLDYYTLNSIRSATQNTTKSQDMPFESLSCSCCQRSFLVFSFCARRVSSFFSRSSSFERNQRQRTCQQPQSTCVTRLAAVRLP